jgi:hypothetical protein
MSVDDDVTLYETKHPPLEPDTPRKEALRRIGMLAAQARRAGAREFERMVADELDRAQDWLAAQESAL